ncbi:MAG: hypothetical protein ACREXG_01250 [Polaromonas sp.]
MKKLSGGHGSALLPVRDERLFAGRGLGGVSFDKRGTDAFNGRGRFSRNPQRGPTLGVRPFAQIRIGFLERHAPIVLRPNKHGNSSFNNEENSPRSEKSFVFNGVRFDTSARRELCLTKNCQWA